MSPRRLFPSTSVRCRQHKLPAASIVVLPTWTKHVPLLFASFNSQYQSLFDIRSLSASPIVLKLLFPRLSSTLQAASPSGRPTASSDPPRATAVDVHHHGRAVSQTHHEHQHVRSISQAEPLRQRSVHRRRGQDSAKLPGRIWPSIAHHDGCIQRRDRAQPSMQRLPGILLPTSQLRSRLLR